MIKLHIDEPAAIPLAVEPSSAVTMTVSEAFIEGGGGGANLMTNKNATASTSQVVVQPDAGYDGMEKVTIEAVPEGVLGVPVISVMTVLGAPMINARCEVENGGILETGEYTAKGVTPASILPTQAGTTITPTSSEQTAVDKHKWTTGAVKVAAIPPEYGKAVQINDGVGRIGSSTYVSTDLEITVAKAGTYDIYWSACRTTTAGTSGTQLYKNGTAQGTAVTTWTRSYIQNPHLTLTLDENDVLTIYARSRDQTYYVCVANLIIIEQ